MTRKTHNAPSRPPAHRLRRGPVINVGAVLAALIFLILAAHAVPFLQDDAYISFRYVDNFLTGKGLVFNPGERVEGYTNFLWVILLALAAKLGFGLEEAARWLGLLFTAGAVVVTVQLARRIFTGQQTWWAVAGSIGAGLWVAVNPAVQYWSVAGLETGMFLFFVTLAVERMAAGSRLCWVALTLATLSRPEGALVFAVCYLWYLFHGRAKNWLKWGQPLLLYLAPLVPFAAFKLIYYGTIFPNPFYAKTGFSPEYWASGLQYVWLYFRQMGLWGALPVLMVMGLIRAGWRSIIGLCALVWLVFTVYIVSIGGDVLHCHRFFVPIWPAFSVAVLGGLFMAVKNARRVVQIGGLIVGVAIPILFLIIPGDYFSMNRVLENGLVRRMASTAYHLQNSNHRPLTVAASTIGRLSYDMRDHIVIDMLGLVDSTIARHPEHIDGLPASWKERHYNAGYVLSREPDYIIFSTDDRPSAPAEKALLLHSRFRRNYSTFIYPHLDSHMMFVIYKRTGADTTDVLWPDPGMPDRLAEGMVSSMRVDSETGRRILQEVRQNGPGDFAVPVQWIGQLYFTDRNIPPALAYFDSALAIDPHSIIPVYLKGCAYYVMADSANLAAMTRELARKAPWLTIP